MPQSAIDQTTETPDSSKRINASDVGQMGSDFFTAMLGMPFDPQPSKETNTPGEDALTASIQVEGTWNATFRVIASKALATEIASTMFDIAPDKLSSDEILDALGETVNVIGGNAKGIINEECNLSLPCIGQYQSPKDEQDWMNLTFDCSGHPLSIHVNEHSAT
jgi:hypothetical protein